MQAKDTPDAVVLIATAWGPKHGGINAFNKDLAVALATHVGVPVLCFVSLPEAADIAAARDEKVTLLTIPAACPDRVAPALAPALIEALRGHVPEVRRPCWIGHDLVSGQVMLECHARLPGTPVLVQHMDYESYEVLKDGDGETALGKGTSQIELVGKAAVIAGIGPKLAALARSRVDDSLPKPVLELIPGLPSIEPASPPSSFSAIAFGRFNRRSEPVKQSRLAVAGFAHAIRLQPATIGRDPKMTLVGLEGDLKLLDELRRIAFEQAQRAVIINGTPFTENREELFDLLRRHSLAMMLSFHEGFGLVGWEAIAAGVPLVISQNSGVYELLDARVLENHVFSVDVRGAADPHMLNEEDIRAVAQQVLLIAGAPQRARGRAQALARKLKSMFTWPRCAFQLATTASVPVQRSPFRLLLAAGHPSIDVCGPSDASAGELSEAQHKARTLWALAASRLAQCVAALPPSRCQVLFAGVDGGTFAAAVVRDLVEVRYRDSDVVTITHRQFADDDEAQRYYQTHHPAHFRTHNVDPLRPYVYLAGTVLRVPGIESRRELLVSRADAVLCVAGQGPVDHMIGLAKARKLPIIAIGAFGGCTAERIDEILEHNKNVGLPPEAETALRDLATALLREDVLLDSIERAWGAIRTLLEQRDASV